MNIHQCGIALPRVEDYHVIGSPHIAKYSLYCLPMGFQWSSVNPKDIIQIKGNVRSLSLFKWVESIIYICINH